MIVLLFGQPASGKTTLAKKFEDWFHIDGDEWRKITGNQDYSDEGRKRNIKSAFDLALHIEKMNIKVVLSFVTPFEELRQYLYDNAKDCSLIYLSYSEDRGRSGYFAKSFDEPSSNCLKLDTSKWSVDESFEQIMKFIRV
jgi:adenylylsulfate kinase-like enzyme